MSALDEYRRLMVALFTSRRQHASDEAEDAILDKMDVVWYRMSAEERKTADALSGCIASGTLTEEQFIAVWSAEQAVPSTPHFQPLVPMHAEAPTVVSLVSHTDKQSRVPTFFMLAVDRACKVRYIHTSVDTGVSHIAETQGCTEEPDAETAKSHHFRQVVRPEIRIVRKAAHDSVTRNPEPIRALV